MGNDLGARSHVWAVEVQTVIKYAGTYVCVYKSTKCR